MPLVPFLFLFPLGNDARAEHTAAAPAAPVEELRMDDEGIGVRWPGTTGLEPLTIERREGELRRGGRVARRRSQSQEPASREFGFHYRSESTFDRVSGLTLWGDALGSGTDDYVPEITIRSGYSLSRERLYYDTGALQPVTRGRYLMLGARFYRLAESHDMDDQIVGNEENSLAGIFFKEDYRDFFEANGEAAQAESRLPGGSTLRASLRSEDLSNLPVGTRWSLFRRHWAFRDNPPIFATSRDEARLEAVEGSYSLDLRHGRDSEEPGLGFYAKLSAESAGRWGMRGDFRYDRYMADLRHYSKLGPELYLDTRVVGGALNPGAGTLSPAMSLVSQPPGSGSLYPLHKVFYVGGLGTLPGYRYKSFTGERMLLASTEYRVGTNVRFLLTADAGDAWTPAERAFELHTDAGTGFELGDHGLRVMVSRPLDESHAQAIWRIRLDRTY